jgi:DGQHR domain-containing protein
MTTVPAIKGHIGDKLYYQCTMNAKDLIARTEPVEEYFSQDEIDEQGEKGKLQRKLNARYLTEVAPYLLRNKDRFIPSIVVNLDTELCEFSSLENFTIPIDGKVHRVKDSIQFDYRDQAANIGFLHIKDVGSMYILDGQHRMAAYRAAMKPSDKEKKSLIKTFEEREETHLMNNASDLKNDQISVLFVSLKDKVEMRKLFTDVNSNARSISQSEKIGMAERNGYFKIVQNIIDDNLVFDHSEWILPQGVSLQPNSLKFIPKKTLTNIVEKICELNDIEWEKNILPSKSELEKVQTVCVSFLNELFRKNIDGYKRVLSSPNTHLENSCPSYRNPKNTFALIMKPLPMESLAEAILLLKMKSDLDTPQIYKAINNIDWSYEKEEHQFLGSIINIDGNIQNGKGIKKRLRNLIIYWVLGPEKAKIFFEDFEDSLEDLTKEWRKATGKKGEIPEVELK